MKSTFLVSGGLALGLFGCAPDNPVSTAGSAPGYVQGPIIAAPKSDWTVETSTDKMTGEKQFYATSNWVGSDSPMSSPYTDTQGMLGIGCSNKGSEWIYVKFTQQPNLVDTKPEAGGYSSFVTRVKWDQAVEEAPMTQKWGAHDIQFTNTKRVLSRLKGASSTVLIELDWYGSGSVYFTFPMDGAAKTLDEIERHCADNQSKPAKDSN